MNGNETRIPKNSSTRIPSFQFYPYDWLSDTKLQSCSIGARGLWIELICLMHDSQQYGYLLINGKKPDDKTLAKLTHTHLKTFMKLKSELIEKGVTRLTSEGVIYSKRMVKDHELREKRREAGKKGGNPLLNQEDNPIVNQEDNHLAEEEKEAVAEEEKENAKEEEILKSVSVKSVVSSNSVSSVDYSALVCPECNSPVEKSGEGYVLCNNCGWADKVEKAKHKI